MELSIIPETYSRLPAELLSSGNKLERQIGAAQAASGQQRKVELKKAAQEFEALFLNNLLKVMRETIEESGLTDSGFGKSTYTELFDQELSRTMSRSGVLGIADMIYKKVSSENPTAAKQESKQIQGDESASPAAPSPAPPQGEGATVADEPEISDMQLPVHSLLSSQFGLRKDPFSRKTQFHKGVDLSAPEGLKVMPALPGKVLSAGYDSGYGNNIVIQHSDGLQTRYGHLGSMNVKAGDNVSTESTLGTVGNTGRSTGPHLHFEVIRMGKQIDPLPEIRAQLSADLKTAL